MVTSDDVDSSGKNCAWGSVWGMSPVSLSPSANFVKTRSSSATTGTSDNGKSASQVKRSGGGL